MALLLGGGVDGGKVHGTWQGLAAADLVDGDLDGVNAYRLILAEILEKRCRAGALTDVFPGSRRTAWAWRCRSPDRREGSAIDGRRPMLCPCASRYAR